MTLAGSLMSYFGLFNATQVYISFRPKIRGIPLKYLLGTVHRDKANTVKHSKVAQTTHL